MSRGRWDGLFWVLALAVLSALFFGLDSYRRQSFPYGYGPARRRLFNATLEKAQQLDASGSYQIAPQEAWHLLHGWHDGDEGGARVRARRGILILPVAIARPLTVQIEARPLQESGKPPAPIEIEYGVNALSLGHDTIPAEGGYVRFKVESSQLFRGDNTIFLYRVTRRADPAPWLEVGVVRVRAE